MTHTKEWYANWKRPQITHSQTTKWGWTVYYPEHLTLGKFVDIGWGCFLQAEAGIVIEDDVEIGGNSLLYSVDTIDGKRGPIILKDWCKIGASCVILPNVTVGENSTIGAGTIVTKNIPPSVVVHPEQRLIIRKR